MDEPKKDLLIEAATKRFNSPHWRVSNVTVNHRKHFMQVTVDVQAKSHAELLTKLEKAGLETVAASV